jgi:Protein of unknown function (DUF1583)
MSDGSNRTRLMRNLVAFTLLAFAAIGSLALQAQPAGGQAKEIYQDLRGRRPLLAEFKLHGAPDVEEVAKPEDGGLRITLPPQREKHWPIEVEATFPLTGDFEITGTYELLSANRPTNGYGVGVALSIASNPARDKFAKVGRLMRAKEGSVHMAEYWRHTPPKDWKGPSQPTQTKLGQLRLVRKGEMIRCLAADEPGKEFQEIFALATFGTEDMELARFEVVDSGAPGNSVDVRLIDLRIRTGNLVPEKATVPAPLAEPAPAPINPAPPAPGAAQPGGEAARSRVWLVAALVVGLAFTLLLVATVGLWLFLRHRGQPATSEVPAAKTRGTKR